MLDPPSRPLIPSKLLRISAALLESGLLLVFGALLLSGVVQDVDSEASQQLPLHVGARVIPILIVAMVYAIQRMWCPRRFAFVLAGAFACALGAAFRAGLEPLQRLLDTLRGFAVGAILTGFLMNIDNESTGLLEGPAKPWRELFFGLLLVTFGAMPMAIYGGFVWSTLTIFGGLAVLIRCIRYDAPTVVPQRNAGALGRMFLAMLFVLLALGFLVVGPMISMGLKSFQ